jgi:exosome complex component RRP43
MIAALKNSTYYIIIILFFFFIHFFFLIRSFTLCSSLWVLSATLPQATFDPEKNMTICSRRAPKLPLQLNPNTPISVSFGIFDSCVNSFRFLPIVIIIYHPHVIFIYRKHLLADPTSFEEPLLDTSISVVVGEQGNLISVSQLGSTLVSQSGGLRRDTLPECIAIAKRRREILSKQIFK